MKERRSVEQDFKHNNGQTTALATWPLQPLQIPPVSLSVLLPIYSSYTLHNLKCHPMTPMQSVESSHTHNTLIYLYNQNPEAPPLHLGGLVAVSLVLFLCIEARGFEPPYLPRRTSYNGDVPELAPVLARPHLSDVKLKGDSKVLPRTRHSEVTGCQSCHTPFLSSPFPSHVSFLTPLICYRCKCVECVLLKSIFKNPESSFIHE